MAGNEIKITCLASLENALEKLHGALDGEALWWRGHTCENWALEAGVFRPRLQGGNYSETALIGNFHPRAIGMLGHRARPNSELDWLLLAQHYGLPTRLLDWTENPLIALFFAVQEGADSSDACLWVVSPTHLNKENSCPANPEEAQLGLIDPDERVVQAMAKQAFGFKDEAIKNYLGFHPSKLPKIIAIVTPEMDPRIIAQSGRFTLHGSAGTLKPLDQSPKYLRKLIVPASEKPKIRQRLEWLGIQRWNLFPDLQSLASGLKRHDFSGDPTAAL